MDKQIQNRQDPACGPVHGEPPLAAASPRCYPSADLFAGANQILISHDGETYRMRITRNRRLILTK